MRRVEAEEVFTTLMGREVSPAGSLSRKRVYVQNLDV
jgi:hypothetical protein